jgi:hypothetical protein
LKFQHLKLLTSFFNINLDINLSCSSKMLQNFRKLSNSMYVKLFKLFTIWKQSHFMNNITFSALLCDNLKYIIFVIKLQCLSTDKIVKKNSIYIPKTRFSHSDYEFLMINDDKQCASLVTLMLMLETETWKLNLLHDIKL